MSFIFRPWQMLAAIFAGAVNRDQQQKIDFLCAQLHVVKEAIGKKRVLLDDDQRRQLAVKGKLLGRKVLEEISTLFTPETILRWHRQLVAQKWDYSNQRREWADQQHLKKWSI